MDCGLFDETASNVMLALLQAGLDKVGYSHSPDVAEKGQEHDEAGALPSLPVQNLTPPTPAENMSDSLEIVGQFNGRNFLPVEAVEPVFKASGSINEERRQQDSNMAVPPEVPIGTSLESAANKAELRGKGHAEAIHFLALIGASGVKSPIDASFVTANEEPERARFQQSLDRTVPKAIPRGPSGIAKSHRSGSVAQGKIQSSRVTLAAAASRSDKQPLRSRKVCSTAFGVVKQPRPPSNFCHICSRKTPPGSAAFNWRFECGNVKSGKCRKVICFYCYCTHSEYMDNAKGEYSGEFICCHCTGVCPPSAQCVLYQLQSLKRKKARDATKAAASQQIFQPPPPQSPPAVPVGLEIFPSNFSPPDLNSFILPGLPEEQNERVIEPAIASGDCTGVQKSVVLRKPKGVQKPKAPKRRLAENLSVAGKGNKGKAHL